MHPRSQESDYHPEAHHVQGRGNKAPGPRVIVERDGSVTYVGGKSFEEIQKLNEEALDNIN